MAGLWNLHTISGRKPSKKTYPVAPTYSDAEMQALVNGSNPCPKIRLIHVVSGESITIPKRS